MPANANNSNGSPVHEIATIPAFANAIDSDDIYDEIDNHTGSADPPTISEGNLVMLSTTSTPIVLASSLNSPASTASLVVAFSSNTPQAARVTPAMTASPAVTSLITSPLAAPVTTTSSPSIPITIISPVPLLAMCSDLMHEL
jgi:hypothetical protein